MVERIDKVRMMNDCRRTLALFTILGLLLPGVLQGQEPSAEPVPSRMLRDGELVVEPRNFAVGTPAGDWQWYLAQGQGEAPLKEMYVCAESASGAEFRVVPMNARKALDAKFIQGFTEGIKESLTAGGLQVVSMDVTDSAVPLPGSYRFQWHALRPDGTSIYGYGYITLAGTVYVLLHATPDADEPPEFVQFVKTFRVLHAPSPAVGPGFMPKIHFLLVAVGCIVAWQVNRARGRAVLNGGTVGAVLVIVAMVVFLVIGGDVCLSTNQPPEKTGEMTGRCLGEALIPLLIAVLISCVFRRRNRARNSPDERPQAIHEC